MNNATSLPLTIDTTLLKNVTDATTLLQNVTDATTLLQNVTDATTLLQNVTDATTLLENVTDSTTDTESGTTVSLVRSALQVLFGLMVFFFNIVILIVICTSKGTFKVTYLFLGHLAVADLLFGFAFALRFVLTLILPASKLFTPCIVIIGMLATSVGTSASGIFFLALQTYLAVKCSRTLQQEISIKQAKVLIALSWIIFVVIGGMYRMFTDIPNFPLEFTSICFIGNKYTNIYPAFVGISILAVYLPTLSLLVVSVKKLIDRHRQIKTITFAPPTVSKPMDTLEVPSTSSTRVKRFTNRKSVDATCISSNGNRILPSPSGSKTISVPEPNIIRPNTCSAGHPSLSCRPRQIMSSPALKHKNSLTIIMAILIIFTVCVGPIIISLFFHDVCTNGCGFTDCIMRTLATFSIVQAFSNCIIYVVRDRSFREQLKKLCCCK